MNSNYRNGVEYLGRERCAFAVWAPSASELTVHIVAPQEREVPLERFERGYWEAVLDSIEPSTRYFYRINGVDRPDPASRHQPEGVHGPSEVVDLGFDWHDGAWFGVPLRDYILYELHVGTFTPEGTFDAVIPHLAELKDLGITAIELMPISQFPGSRNWGYDGVDLFAPQESYGGPQGLQRLVDACHQTGLAVVLDVVYNHFGPEGNYLRDFGPYFNDCTKTLWGSALNFDGPHSDEVRQFFLENALYWQTEFHIDALRLDAVHAIRDGSAVPFLQELARATHRQSDRLNRRFHLIAESDLNDARLILPEQLGGYGLDAHWSDDFHHCLHVLLTGEHTGYYEDFSGLRQFARAFRDGYAYTGQRSAHRQRRHGNSPRLTSTKQLVVYAQNHDQVGNRLLGDRLSRLTSFESLKLAAGSVLLSPFIPMLFMGEEYGEAAPFQYITSHSDPELVAAVREGRRQEFAHFHGADAAPDPQAESTFRQNKLDWELPRRDRQHDALRQFYRQLIRLRKELPALAEADRDTMEVQSFASQSLLTVHYWSGASQVLVLLCFANDPGSLSLEIPPGHWRKMMDSTSRRWAGQGSCYPNELKGEGALRLDLAPKSIALFQLSDNSQ